MYLRHVSHLSLISTGLHLSLSCMKSSNIQKNTILDTRSLQKGLTFIELIVVMSIFSIIASVVLFNFSSFSTNITSQNLAQEIALQIKEAQTSALSGVNPSIFQSDPDLNKEGAPSYGVRFNIDPSNTEELDGKSMVFFGDRNGNDVYDTTGTGCDYSVTGTECLAMIHMNTSDTIVGICKDAECDDGLYTESKATLIFRRPFPEGRLFASDDGIPRSKVGVKIRSVKGDERAIIATILGQIMVTDIQEITLGNPNDIPID